MDRPFGKMDHEVCSLLRWKAMFYQAESVPEVPPSNDRSFWCAQTQVVIGPDGQVAEPESCRPNRSCYDQLTVIKFT